MVALLFQLAAPLGLDQMNIVQMRRQLMKKSPLQSTGWNNLYGYGRVDGVAVALALAPQVKLAAKTDLTPPNGNGGSKPAVIELTDPQGNRWRMELKQVP